MRSAKPILITFSGIDGAGKSTQIAAVERHLRHLGFRIIRCEFWDQIAAFRKFRETVSIKAFKGDEGAGSPERPIHRRDKNVDHWYLQVARLFFYAVDALNLRFRVRRLSRADCDLVVFDRYIYDELANLPLTSRLMRTYANFILEVAPEPDVAYLLDTDPGAARMRKPEYPIEFLHHNRESYLRLSRLAQKILVVHTRSEAETFSEILPAIDNLQPPSVAETVAP